MPSWPCFVPVTVLPLCPPPRSRSIRHRCSRVFPPSKSPRATVPVSRLQTGGCSRDSLLRWCPGGQLGAGCPSRRLPFLVPCWRFSSAAPERLCCEVCVRAWGAGEAALLGVARGVLFCLSYLVGLVLAHGAADTWRTNWASCHRYKLVIGRSGGRCRWRRANCFCCMVLLILFGGPRNLASTLLLPISRLC